MKDRPLDTLESMAFAEWLISMNLDEEASDTIESYRLAWVAAIEFEKTRTDIL